MVTWYQERRSLDSNSLTPQIYRELREGNKRGKVPLMSGHQVPDQTIHKVLRGKVLRTFFTSEQKPKTNAFEFVKLIKFISLSETLKNFT